MKTLALAVPAVLLLAVSAWIWRPASAATTTAPDGTMKLEDVAKLTVRGNAQLDKPADRLPGLVNQLLYRLRERRVRRDRRPGRSTRVAGSRGLPRRLRRPRKIAPLGRCSWRPGPSTSSL